MIFNVLTLFPELFEPFLKTSLFGAAGEKGLITLNLVQIRDFTTDKHRTVDDTPYGGGAGMILKIEPIAHALTEIKKLEVRNAAAKRHTTVLSAKGGQLTQVKAEEYAKLDELTLICGRYEGIDQRVADHLADEEISIGPYVLNGGETAAMVVIEAVSRLIPGVIGNPESLKEESFQYPTLSPPLEKGGGFKEYPQYTKPAEYNGWKVPEVLLSGNHEEIRKWREEQRRQN